MIVVGGKNYNPISLLLIFIKEYIVRETHIVCLLAEEERCAQAQVIMERFFKMNFVM